MLKRDKILIIDDEPDIREFLAEVVSERYQALLAANGDDGIRIAKEKKPTAVILDILMPGKNGVEVCKLLREMPETQTCFILMLTALDDPEQRIKAFSAGADDFISKPVHPDELLARLNSKLRRAREADVLRSNFDGQPGLVSSVGNLKINYESHSVSLAGKNISLGSIEFRILMELFKSKDQLVHRKKLAESVWESEGTNDRALDPHVTALRKKIKDSNVEIKTVYSVGFTLLLRQGKKNVE